MYMNTSSVITKKGKPIPILPKAKHPYKVHVWAALSAYGLVGIHLFEKNLNADYYCEIIENNLLT